jgi:hypothetical protein
MAPGALGLSVQAESKPTIEVQPELNCLSTLIGPPQKRLRLVEVGHQFQGKL